MKRRLLRRLVFYPLLAGFIAASAWWSFVVPRHPDRVFRPVPASARWVSLHRRLADRWLETAAHPLVRQAAALSGLDPVSWDEFVRAPSVRMWVKRLCSDDLVLAAWRESGSEDWAVMGVSWIGGRSQRFRWMLMANKVKGVQRVGDYTGRPVWMWTADTGIGGRRLYFAMEEGIVIGVWAGHPRELCRALDAYDGVMPRLSRAADLQGRPESDVGWGVLGVGPGPDACEVRLRSWANGGLRAKVECSGWEGLKHRPPPREKPDYAPVARLWGGLPEVVAGADWSWARTWFPSNTLWSVEARALGDDRACGPVVGALFGSPLWSRLFGLRTPGIMLAAPVKSPGSFCAAVDARLDRINAVRKWGLIAGPDSGVSGMRVFEAPGIERYAELPASERAAFVVTNGWALGVAGSETLRSLWGPPAQTNGVNAARTPDRTGDWRVAARRGGDFWVWADLDRGTETLRLALAVYDLKMMTGGRSAESSARRSVQTARRLIDLLEPFGRLMATGTVKDGAMTITLELLPEAGP